jgi:Tol biopolymer transport system component
MDGMIYASPGWSPDGSWITFTAAYQGNVDIYVMAADDGEVTRVTTHAADDTSPVWTFDGQRIMFASNRDGRMQLYTVFPNGGDMQLVRRSEAGDNQPNCLWG